MTEIVILIILIVLCLVAEAFFSGTETGMISLNRIRLRHLAEEGDERAAFLHSTLASPDSLLATTLVGTNLAVVSGSALAMRLVTKLHPEQASLLTTILMIPLIVIFGEIVPKAVFRRRPLGILLPSVPLLRIALFLLRLPAKAIGIVSRTLLDWVDSGKAGRSPFVTKDELLHLIKAGVREGTLEPVQQRMLHGAFSFAATSTREAMIPLTDVVAIPEGAVANLVFDRARETGLVRFPVYRERIDQVVGIINVSDLLFAGIEDAAPIDSFVRLPMFLPNTVSLDSALLRMQRGHDPMAIVVDEYGGCDGIVTIQDIIEQVVGDLDHGRDIAREITVLSPTTFQIEAHIDLDRLNDELGLNLPKHNYETLSGFLMTRFGRIPRVGEKLVFGTLQFEVLSRKGPTIETVHLRCGKG